MIHIDNKENCCGCAACVQCCPKQCIYMTEDDEGFLYPQINTGQCVDCGLCEKVCPVINQNEKTSPRDILAAVNLNEQVRLDSSSGGVFSSLSEAFLQENGVVFGARFNKEWEVIHDSFDNIDDLALFRGSKYVQSNIGNTFKDAETFLKNGTKVLFVGTPCQIAGLKRFLRRDYENLLTVDFVCHGVPSPKVWRMFLKEQYDNVQIVNIEFRNKAKGWRNYSLILSTAQEQKIFSIESNIASYMKGFLKEIYLRPSCYKCPAKSFKSGSDITIGDYWWIKNIDASWDDDKGCSIVYINSIKGNEVINQLNLKTKPTNTPKNIKEAYLFLGAVSTSAVKPMQRSLFFENVEKINLSNLIFTLTKETTGERIKNRIKCSVRKKTLLYSLYRFLKNKI